MTLIIAGYEKVKDDWVTAFGHDNQKQMTLRNDGLFAVSDSIITVNGSKGDRPILSGLRKIHQIPIKVWIPYFVDGNFRDYVRAFIETECFVAFAGSTLTANHALNLISEHLRKLQISHKSHPEPLTPGTYVIQRHCEYNELRDSLGYRTYDEDMFQIDDYRHLPTADYISTVIEHSINVALRSAKKYRLTQNEVQMMSTDFVAGIHCPVTNSDQLYIYRMCQRSGSDGVIEVYVDRALVPEGKVAVLGMRSEFEERAQAAYEIALKDGRSTGAELFRFLNDAIGCTVIVIP